MILELRPRIKKRMYIHHITKTLYRKFKKLEEWLLELEDKAINADD